MANDITHATLSSAPGTITGTDWDLAHVNTENPWGPPLRTGGTFYYSSHEGAYSTLILVQDTMYATPFFVPYTATFSSLALVCTGVASSQARFGIYTDNGGVPDALVVDAGASATTGTGVVTKAFSQSFPRGWIWLAVAVQGAAGSLFCNTSSFIAGKKLPLTAPGFSTYNGGYATTGVSGALNSPWGATKTETARVPVMYIAPA